ncbi:MAG TPA: virulence RhuM family protein [Candidatus Ornithomonoglobus merdipullorum]|uniref:Virulence RhuM family protein n=1 Tax=Candidatus Ornithomonoglobus merdipullorum TaxID=2840895 RepID=A0A9D1SFG7_9FIRM|nr:virulence RhuM family protein [Candidatus Ornithomonoglobus merdipullorum]
MSKVDKNEITIRSSAAEYLTYVASIGDESSSMEMRYEDEDIWLTQKMMATLYDVDVRTINYHIKKIFNDSELQENSVIRKFRITAQDGKIKKSDVTIAKNYLSEFEMRQLDRMVSAYLDFAESMTLRHIPLTMQDWETRLNGFIEMFEYGLLKDAGKVSAEIAKLHAETEFEKYRVIQDKQFMSDFDRYMLELEEIEKTVGKQKNN